MTTILQKLGAAAILLAATAVVPACTQSADKAQLDKIAKDASDAKIAAESAAKSAAEAADAAKAAQQAADQASAAQTHATGKHMRNK
jgi:hypothetical protein